MSTQLMKTPLGQVKDVKSLLMNESARNQLAMVAAKHMNPERMMRVLSLAIRTTPKLAQCEPMSLLGALMQCASMGLEPNNMLGHAYLIPFENRKKGITEVQLVIGYKGFIDMARRSGQLASIHADVVMSDDAFSHSYGSNQHLNHVPGPRKGEIIGFYCHVKLNLGDGCVAEGHRYMTVDEVIAHRDQYSQGWKTAVRFNRTQDSPWTTAFPQMGMKTVVRAMANRGEIPLSIEFMEGMAVDEREADFRAFAFDPSMGVAPMDMVEGEAQEQETAPTQIEERRAAPDPVQQDAAPRRQRQAAAKQERAPDTGLPLAPQEAKPAAMSEEDAERFHNWTNTILADLEDGSHPDEVSEVWGPQLEMIAARAPDLDAKIKRAMNEARG